MCPCKAGGASGGLTLRSELGQGVALVEGAKLYYSFHDSPHQNFAAAPGGVLSCPAKPGGLQLAPCFWLSSKVGLTLGQMFSLGTCMCCVLPGRGLLAGAWEGGFSGLSLHAFSQSPGLDPHWGVRREPGRPASQEAFCQVEHFWLP